MKKIIIFALLCTMTLVLVGCGKQEPAETTDAAEYIGADKALELAKELARVETDGIFDIAVELTKGEKAFYAVTFESDTEKYEYDIDAVSGKLLRGKRKGKPQTMAPIRIQIPNVTVAPETTAAE